MRTVVTGGAGFIGSHLVKRLLADGHRIKVIDNFSTGREENLTSVKKNSHLKIYKVDITDIRAVSKIIKDVDWVFHLAALSALIPSIENPLNYFHSNVFGTGSVLEASRKVNVSRFIYAASSSCYGIPDKYPTSEKAAIKTEYPYAESKYLGERLVMHYGRIYKLPVISLRLFNVYGSGVRTDSGYGAALGIFMAQKLNNKPMTIVGDGRQVRDFVFVTDVVDALIKSAGSKIKNEIFNVGSGNPQSVNTMVQLIGGTQKVYLPKRPGEPSQTYADISKIKSQLGWQPRISFQKGIKMAMDAAVEWRQAPVWTKAKIKKATALWFKYLS